MEICILQINIFHVKWLKQSNLSFVEVYFNKGHKNVNITNILLLREKIVEGTLIFCEDGILRLQTEFDTKESIPLEFIQKFENAKDDPFFLFDYLNHPVACEEGVSLANIMFALSPWTPILSRMLGIDLEAYLAEIRKPTELEVDLEWISINTVTFIAIPSFPLNLESVNNFDVFFNEEDASPKGFVIETSTKAYGYIKDDNNAYAIDGDIQTLKNLPVYIDPVHYIIDYKSPNTKSHLFNLRAKGVQKYGEKGSFIESIKTCALRDFLDGLFKKGIYYPNPEISLAENEKLDAISFSLNESEEEVMSTNHQLTLVDENAPNDFETFSNQLLDNMLGQEGLNDVLEDFIDYFNERQRQWDELTKACHHDDDFQIRIGQIKIGKVPQRNLLDEILKTKAP